MNAQMLTLLRGSLANRAFSLGLIVVTLACAVALYVGVQNVQRLTRASFENSISGVDLVVAARGSDVQILLNTVFGLGASGNLVSDETVAAVADMPEVAWVVPLALGDSHRGFRVLGTSPEFFERVIPSPSSGALFAAGGAFEQVLEAVVGADVAEALGYMPGDKLVLQHGLGDYGAAHDDLPFRVHGVLARTGTPFDRTVLVSVEAIEAIHRGWRNGQQLVELSPEQVEKSKNAHEDEHHHKDGHHGEEHHEDEHHGEEHHEDEHHGEEHHEDEHHGEEHHDHAHAGGLDALDGFFVGLTERRNVVRVQRNIADYEPEPLTAVIPGVTLAQIWQIIGVADRGFRAVSLLVIALVLLAMTAMTVLSTDSRRREMAILRALGASPSTLVGLILAEALFLAICASAMGLGLAIGVSVLAQQWLTQTIGLVTTAMLPGWREMVIVAYIIPAALVAGLVPALRLYRRTVQDGIMVER
ncbi:MAG: ABC transporter permease [Pseudomonadota bacterium]|nr:ABC transporter permease [Pseudomonadota bacterium]